MRLQYLRIPVFLSLVVALLLLRTPVLGQGVITTVAGIGGVEGFAGDGGPATSALFNFSAGVALGPDGSIYIADLLNHRIRKVDPDGIISTVAGNGPVGQDEGSFSGDGGPATSARLNEPTDVAVGPDGSIYIVDSSNRRIRKVDPQGIITTVAGNGEEGFGGDGGPATDAGLMIPDSIKLGSDGSLYFSDVASHRIRKVRPDGIIITVAGSGPVGPDAGTFSGDGGMATSARLNNPEIGSVLEAGSFLIADLFNHRIRKVDAFGMISTIAGSGPIGDGFGAFAGDGGPAVGARLNFPVAVIAIPDGSLFISDSENHRIRNVDPQGIITTVAGTGEEGFEGDGGPALNSKLHTPAGIAVDDAGNIFVADLLNNAIRKITFPSPQSDVVIDSVEPGSGRQGEAMLDLTIFGIGFTETPDVIFRGGGIIVDSITFEAATRLTLTIRITETAAAGEREVIVTNPDGGSATGTFTVTSRRGDPGETVSVTSTTRVRPQVLAAGVDPIIVDRSDTQLNFIAIVRPGAVPIERVIFSQNTGVFSFTLLPSHTLSNGDVIYRSAFSFDRGSFGTTVLNTVFGPLPEQFNFTVIDQGEQSHSFPNIEFGNTPAAKSLVSVQVLVNDEPGIKRLRPQVLAAGIDPILIDTNNDTSFEMFALVRAGAAPIKQVTFSQNRGPFSIILERDEALPNGDMIYRGRFEFTRGSFGISVLRAIFGPEDGQFNFVVIDEAEQRHAFPDLTFGDFPALP